MAVHSMLISQSSYLASIAIDAMCEKEGPRDPPVNDHRPGAYNINPVGEVVPTSKKYKKVRAAGVLEVVWKHTMQVFEEIEAGKKFTG
ncbi:hypothetical protein ACMFMG_003133 [Clarireedia jacksonii]